MSIIIFEMATSGIKFDDQNLKSLKDLLWGNGLKDEVFSRWTQGFVFSGEEPTALVQYEGGPCAVIAPVQAFVLKKALFAESPKEDLKKVSSSEANELLLQALGDILAYLSSGEFSIVSMEERSLQQQADNKGDNSENQSNSSEVEQSADSSETFSKRPRLDQELFHTQLRCCHCHDEDSMRSNIKAKFSNYTQNTGVLLFLYSVILTKGLEQIKNEVEDPGEPLIDGIHGHGSQSLINLLITGKAVSNVFDNDRDVSGLKLCGIPRQANIGFLTLMEHLRYCEVGWFLKNPRFPVWLLASETHLTVLFSKERGLVTAESQENSARHIFNRFDPEGNGFISTSLLGDLLAELDLVAEKEYVDIMKEKLDSESLGIITMSSFMEEFYPEETTPEVPKVFRLYHYNGLARSCPDNKIKYVEGRGSIQDELEVQIVTDTSSIKMCLLTKWPTIELDWIDSHIPSLN